ncbi:Speedy Protein E7-Like [Manis pentadactyla]|nr:Speedy Protein E7-Like [Manis pentadactyla]
MPADSGRRGKRARSAALQEESEEAAQGEEDAWVPDMLCGLKMRLKRRRVSPVLPEHHEAFKRLLGDPVVKRFLAWDKNLRVSDKYLLAMVIAYFSRAGLPSWQYQTIHFFIALYLANDMEEDDEGPKQAILWLLYGNNRARRLLFHQRRVHSPSPWAGGPGSPGKSVRRSKRLTQSSRCGGETAACLLCERSRDPGGLVAPARKKGSLDPRV